MFPHLDHQRDVVQGFLVQLAYQDQAKYEEYYKFYNERSIEFGAEPLPRVEIIKKHEPVKKEEPAKEEQKEELEQVVEEEAKPSQEEKMEQAAQAVEQERPRKRGRPAKISPQA